MASPALTHARNPKLNLQYSRKQFRRDCLRQGLFDHERGAGKHDAADKPVHRVTRQGKKEVRADSKRTPHVSNSAQVGSWYPALLKQFNLWWPDRPGRSSHPWVGRNRL